MSIYTFKKAGDGLMELRRHGTLILSIFPSEVPALYACVGAAMAESNTAVMSGCKCGGRKSREAICNTFMPIHGNPQKHCARCAHDGPCHQPQEPAREGNEQ